MLKKSATRRIFTATFALFIASILYFFPSNNSLALKENISYIDINKVPIYLINKDNYLVRANIASKEDDNIEKIKYLILCLTINSGLDDNLPKNLKPIIPQNTKILDISLENGLLKINFSKEFLNVSLNDEEKLIESIIYTLTEIPSIKEIMIFVENSKLEFLPQSNIILPSVLTRDYGINKVYDITNIKDITKTTIYYIGKDTDYSYYIPITKIDNNKNNKVEIIINELKSSPIYETNLISYLASSVELLNYETNLNTINLTFNNEIFSDFKEKNILEEVKYSIALSLKDSIHVKEVNFLVDGGLITTFSEN